MKVERQSTLNWPLDIFPVSDIHVSNSDVSMIQQDSLKTQFHIRHKPYAKRILKMQIQALKN